LGGEVYEDGGPGSEKGSLGVRYIRVTAGMTYVPEKSGLNEWYKE
jgi:hypothetical protein